MALEKILVVDDEPGVRKTLAAILGDEGYAVTTAGSGEEGLTNASASRFDALLLDVWLPGIDGIETLRRLKEQGIDAEVIMISGHGTIDTAVKATKLGAYDFVEKPLSLERTLLVLRNALRQRRLVARNRVLLAQLTRDTEIVGRSAFAERTRSAAKAAAATDTPVLVCGEPGTGRETVARAIHAAGHRSEEAFVHVPCGALDERLAESLLFGAEGEAGRLALAAGGSVFLADVDRLPPGAQARLAAWLAGRPDVRVLGSAGPDASGLVSPLKEHVDVLRIPTLPLRERREDIAPLAERFLRDLTREYGRKPKTLDTEAGAALVRHDWPGNVRALRNVMERLVLLSPADTVSLADLPSEVGGGAHEAEDLYALFDSLAAGRAAFERYFVARALREAGGDRAEAARRLGVTLHDLDARMGPR